MAGKDLKLLMRQTRKKKKTEGPTIHNTDTKKIKKQRKPIVPRKQTLRKLVFSLVDAMTRFTEEQLKRKVSVGAVINERPTSENNIFEGSHFELLFSLHNDEGTNRTRVDHIFRNEKDKLN